MSATPVSAGHQLLGELLLGASKVSAQDLDRALELQQTSRDRLGRLLVDLGMLTERDLLDTMSSQLHLPKIEAAQFPALPPEVKGISSRFMRSGKFFPFDQRDSELCVAVADPLDHETIESIRLVTGQKPVVYIAT